MHRVPLSGGDTGHGHRGCVRGTVGHGGTRSLLGVRVGAAEAVLVASAGAVDVDVAEVFEGGDGLVDDFALGGDAGAELAEAEGFGCGFEDVTFART